MTRTKSRRTAEELATQRERRMSLKSHLLEFRRRATIAAAAVVVGLIIAFIFTDPVIDLITEPIRAVAAARGDDGAVALMYQEVTGPFNMRLRIAFAVGLIGSAPVWLWQLWAFLMPGLTRKEIKFTLVFMLSAVPLFALGVFVAWKLMPNIVTMMAGFTPEGAANMYNGTFYYDFVLKLLLVVGVAFILPVFLVALNLAGVISGTAILKGWRIAVLIATLFAGIATPAADVVSMLLIAGILIVLYFAAAGLTLLLDRRRAKRLDAELSLDNLELRTEL